MSILYKLPEFLPSNEVLWQEGDYTFVVGPNGSGKTLLLNKMAEWAESHNYSYSFYDAMTSLELAPILMEQASDEDIIFVAKMFMEFSGDFKDDVFNWTKAKNGHTVDQIGPIGGDADLLREIFKMSGSGYSRLFVMLYMAIDEGMGTEYYFLDMPEASLHIHLARYVLQILMRNFPYTKFVITTHSPDIIDDRWDTNHIIEMKSEYIKDCQNHKWDEIFS